MGVIIWWVLYAQLWYSYENHRPVHEFRELVWHAASKISNCIGVKDRTSTTMSCLEKLKELMPAIEECLQEEQSGDLIAPLEVRVYISGVVQIKCLT